MMSDEEIRAAARRRWAVADLVDRLRAEISTLNEPRRAALLGYLGGESFAATGRRLGKTGEAVRWGLRHAVADLGHGNRSRRILGKEFDSKVEIYQAVKEWRKK